MELDTWRIDTGHSGVFFSVRHMMIANVRGTFTRFRGQARWNGADFRGCSIELSVDASSIDTHEPDRDVHLRTAEFLDVENHPEFTFKSTAIRALSEHDLEVTGELTIRGHTREVKVQVEFGGRLPNDPFGHERAGFLARTSVDRRDFGIVVNKALEAGGVLLGERVLIEADIELVKVRTV